MNIYRSLNHMIAYIEENLENEISYEKLAKLLGVNEYTMHKLFSLLCGIPLGEYIRKRRLSNAGADLFRSEKLIDVALKYHYENPTSFSRAFEKFHGIKPSQIKEQPDNLKFYARLTFSENISAEEPIEYGIEKRRPLVLYGKFIPTTETTISHDAPAFFQQMIAEYDALYGDFNYGMTVYEGRFVTDHLQYWVLYDHPVPGFTRYELPESTWLIFRSPSYQAKDIQAATAQFYSSFLPSGCPYTLRDLPDLEHYHGSVTDILIPIEDPS